MAPSLLRCTVFGYTTNDQKTGPPRNGDLLDHSINPGMGLGSPIIKQTRKNFSAMLKVGRHVGIKAFHADRGLLPYGRLSHLVQEHWSGGV